MKKLVKKLLPDYIKQLVRKTMIIIRFENRMRLERNIQPCYYLLATPNHGNIGDQAIAIAERTFLACEFSDRMVIEISFNEYEVVKERLEKYVKKEDIVCYHGGGNMGTQYFECEDMFRDIIKRFPKNKIIAFPQTIYYSEEKESQVEFEKSKSIYNMHPDLHLFARESISYDVMKEAYPNCDVNLVPDIVLYLERTNSIGRNGVATFLRNDVEKKITSKEVEKIFSVLRIKYQRIVESDTMCEMYNVTPKTREKLFSHKLDEFRRAEIAVTDRLHGMVFAYLTNTPCIVMSNYNYKVMGVYDWIKESRRIKFIDRIDELETAMEEVCTAEEVFVQFDKSSYKKLKETLNFRAV